jgi:glycosyltransferase involved in cell wall biosynthesis
MPKVTVLVPAHNAELTLAETLDSLRLQSFKDFEVLLVDDASSDGTGSIAQAFASHLQIRILRLRENVGVSEALNCGLRIISSPYIARIDADDIATPDRLERQVRFLDDHPHIDVCGTTMEVFTFPSIQPNWILSKPLDDAAIKTSLIQSNAISHPSTIIRKSFFDDVGLYDSKKDLAEDYDLWCRGALLGKNYANLPNALVRYRQHDGQVSTQKRALQIERDLAVKRKYISAILNGQSSEYLAEFFSQEMAFTSRETALMVVQQSIPLLFQMHGKVPNQALFQEMISGCIHRHLA